MGFRTVVMLNNDQASSWSHDPELGKRIVAAMSGNMAYSLPYGSVVECVHADTQTLAVLDMYDGFKPLSHGGWCRGEADDEAVLRLLKEAVDKLGYRMVRKTVKGKP